MQIVFDTAIPLLEIYPVEMFGLVQNDVCARLFTAEL